MTCDMRNGPEYAGIFRGIPKRLARLAKAERKRSAAAPEGCTPAFRQREGPERNGTDPYRHSVPAFRCKPWPLGALLSPLKTIKGYQKRSRRDRLDAMLSALKNNQSNQSRRRVTVSKETEPERTGFAGGTASFRSENLTKPNIAAALRLSGHLASWALNQAVGKLGIAHPHLRSRVMGSNSAPEKSYHLRGRTEHGC